MDDEKRRRLHQPIESAVNKDPVACRAIEHMIRDLERKGDAEDAASALEIVARLAPEHIYHEILLGITTQQLAATPGISF